ncbi:hypothetical protein VPH35_047040 [Triticum aestivum]
MRKYRRNKKQHQLLPTLAPYLMATCGFLCLLLTSPAWFPDADFFEHLHPGPCGKACVLTTLPDLATAFLLSPKCLFVADNLIVAFLIAQSRLALKSQPASIMDVDNIHEEYVKRSAMPMTTKTTTTTVAFSNQCASVEAVWEGEKEREKEEEEEEEEQKRVDDFIARVKRQRKLEGKSFFDTDR